MIYDSQTGPDRFAAMRQAMVDSQLRTSDVTDPRIVAAMGAVPREAFVPARFAELAYIDRPVPLTAARALNAPLPIGRMLVAADPRPDDRALLIGAGSGYTAAVLARLTGSVVALEEDDALHAQAQEQLNGTANVTLVKGPLPDGWPDQAPYSLILIDGAVEQVPAALARQLAPQGRLICALAHGGVISLCRGLVSGNAVALTPFADIDTAPLPGFAIKQSFVFS